MLLETSIYKEIFGNLIFHEVQKVLKIDTETASVRSSLVQNIPREEIYNLLGEMAVVIPLKDEKLQLLDGVLKAIPHKCPLIIVSGSRRESPDHFKLEVDLVKHFYSLTRTKIIMIHQKDAGLSEAFEKSGYNDILTKEGNVRDGKGEGMVIGTLLAKAIGAKFIGFIDADNYIPGSVNEYVKNYAAGFLMSESENTMVRLRWRHKPKVRKWRLYFRKWGRVSEITNRFFNLLIAEYTGFETNIIVTGNAGEHAMSTRLASSIEFSTGYSVEPYQIVFLLEQANMNNNEKIKKEPVEIFQIETLNPHIHEEKGDEHLGEMIKMSLSTIYHSKLCSPSLKKQILKELQARKILEEGKEPEKPYNLPPISKINTDGWFKNLENNSETLLILEPYIEI